jgi:lactate dehydrogenase-like 2-hydroxyacid dehydrogenase
MAIGYHNRAAVAGSPYRYFDRLIELATWADCLICAAPGGAGTRHLVNVGRGTVVDTQALIAALRSQRIAGAGLDVLEGEPSVPPILPELLQCDNVVVTPHVAGRAPESRTAATAMILDNLNAYFAGKPLPFPVSFKG